MTGFGLGHDGREQINVMPGKKLVQAEVIRLSAGTKFIPKTAQDYVQSAVIFAMVFDVKRHRFPLHQLLGLRDEERNRCGQGLPGVYPRNDGESQRYAT